jgi:hypothetical protein
MNSNNCSIPLFAHASALPATCHLGGVAILDIVAMAPAPDLELGNTGGHGDGDDNIGGCGD